MAENKTQATTASVKSYLAAIKDASRRKDCEVLATVVAERKRRHP